MLKNIKRLNLWKIITIFVCEKDHPDDNIQYETKQQYNQPKPLIKTKDEE